MLITGIAWEKLVKWVKGAWKKVTGVFKKKDKTAT
jgi:hypothetical protein